MEQKKIKINLNKPEVVKRFLQVARTFLSDIDIMTESAVLDAKSIMGLFSLDLTHPLDLKIYSEDEAVVKSVIESLDDFNYVVK